MTSKRGNRWHGGRCPVSGDSRQPGAISDLRRSAEGRVRLTLCGRSTGRKLDASDDSRRRGKQNAGQRRGTQTRGAHTITHHLGSSTGGSPPRRTAVSCPAGHVRARPATHGPGPGPPMRLDSNMSRHPSRAPAVQSDWFNGQRSETTPSSADVRVRRLRPRSGLLHRSSPPPAPPPPPLQTCRLLKPRA